RRKRRMNGKLSAVDVASETEVAPETDAATMPDDQQSQPEGQGHLSETMTNVPSDDGDDADIAAPTRPTKVKILKQILLDDNGDDVYTQDDAAYQVNAGAIYPVSGWLNPDTFIVQFEPETESFNGQLRIDLDAEGEEWEAVEVEAIEEA